VSDRAWQTVCREKMSLGTHQLEGTAMRSVLHAVKRFVQSEDGPTAVEYAVMLALIVVVCIAAITSLGQSAKDKFNLVSDTVTNAAPQ
jgi:pilus assembly protein Flp/PilA